MGRLEYSFDSAEDKENFISDVLRHKHHRVKHISKEYGGKGKSLYRKIRIDLAKK
jgi:hypothetical protein